MVFTNHLYKLSLFVFLVSLSSTAGASDNMPTLPAPELDESGVYKQEWFSDSFLDLREDLSDAAKDGKKLVIIWEQNGCPYCKKMHEVNLRIPRIVKTIKDSFVVIQLNLWGDREVTDFDGSVMPEKKLAMKYAVRYTPTIQFFPDNLEKTNGKSGKDIEVHRLMGYFFPYHFITTFEYVRDKAYLTEPNFQRYLITKGREILATGKEVDLVAEHLPE